QALAALADANDQAAARSSLDAELRHWRDCAPITARAWIAAELADLQSLAGELGLAELLLPLQQVLSQGNQAMQWLEAHAQGASVAELIASAAADLEQLETRLGAQSTINEAGTLG
ncbi:MAG: putative glutamate--cysteine ligase, partial [Vulcanococcus sp.]